MQLSTLDFTARIASPIYFVHDEHVWERDLHCDILCICGTESKWATRLVSCLKFSLKVDTWANTESYS